MINRLIQSSFISYLSTHQKVRNTHLQFVYPRFTYQIQCHAFQIRLIPPRHPIQTFLKLGCRPRMNSSTTQRKHKSSKKSKIFLKKRSIVFDGLLQSETVMHEKIDYTTRWYSYTVNSWAEILLLENGNANRFWPVTSIFVASIMRTGLPVSWTFLMALAIWTIYDHKVRSGITEFCGSISLAGSLGPLVRLPAEGGTEDGGGGGGAPLIDLKWTS